MKYNIRIEKELIADNGKHFSEGSEIAFDLKRNFSDGTDHYLGEIKKITEDNKIVLHKVEINNVPVTAEIVISLDDIVDNSCCFVSVD